MNVNREMSFDWDKLLIYNTQMTAPVCLSLKNGIPVVHCRKTCLQFSVCPFLPLKFFMSCLT